MAQSEKLPYPPGPDPDEVPDDLTDYPSSYLTRERLLLLCQFMFLAIYLAFVLIAALWAEGQLPKPSLRRESD